MIENEELVTEYGCAVVSLRRFESCSPFSEIVSRK